MVVAEDISIQHLEQSQEKREILMITANIISQTSGRLRIRLARESRDYKVITALNDYLKKSLDIYRIRTNISTGSITIFYATNLSNFEQIKDYLLKLGVQLLDSNSSSYSVSEKSLGAEKIVNFLGGVNQRVGQQTKGTADLRLMVPLGFSILAIRQLLIKGLILDYIPWYVLAWYAFDSFIKLHYINKP
jgi:hypothetical protein